MEYNSEDLSWQSSPSQIGNHQNTPPTIHRNTRKCQGKQDHGIDPKPENRSSFVSCFGVMVNKILY